MEIRTNTPPTRPALAVRACAIAASLVVFATLGIRPAPARAEDSARVAELERKLDAVIDELEQMRAGTPRDTAGLASRFGFGPAASKVYAGHGVSIGGYGEMLFTRDDDAGPGGRDRLDFLRSVLYVGYRFDETLHFNSEIELEHAGIADEAEVEVDPGTGEGEAELTGEVVLEFAYLDWAPRRELGVRAGMLLAPVGITNEMHEPTTFIGARRSELERRVIPATWSGNGIGVFGEFESGFAYRAYLMEGLDGSHFSATGGIRGGRQGGSQSKLTHPALVARVDYTGVAGLLVGGSAFSGGAWQTSNPAGAAHAPRVTLLEGHARGQWRGLEVVALAVNGRLGEAGPISDALGLTGAERLGERFGGVSLAAAWEALGTLRPGSRWRLGPYVRFESLDTQDDVPGGVEDPAADLSVVTAGASLQPHPGVILKLDRTWVRDDADVETTGWNAALGYVF